MKNKINQFINYKMILSLSIITFSLIILSLFKYIFPYFTTIIQLIKPLIIGYVVAYFVYPIILKLDYFLKWRILSIMSLIILILLLSFGFIKYIAPVVYVSMIELMNVLEGVILDIDKILNHYSINLSSLLNKNQDLLSYLIKELSLINTFQNFISYFIQLIVNIFIYLIFTIYSLLHYESINQYIKRFTNRLSPKLNAYFIAIDTSLKYYFKTSLILLFIQATLYFILLFLFKHPYTILLSILQGVFSIIPYFGPLFVSVLIMITAINFSPAKLFLLFIGLFIISNIDSYFITPKLYSKQTQIPSILIIFTVFTFSHYFNFIGLIIAIPFLLCLKSIISTYMKINKEEA